MYRAAGADELSNTMTNTKSGYDRDEFCKIEVRHTLERKNVFCFFLFKQYALAQ